ncbi:hypothetical protein AHiyo4_26040 [Arthrobacter sp. Hiyo4]|nr:hypothetical protein AHiyo4_26040 [Arthrobacter sp. Hiyo4]
MFDATSIGLGSMLGAGVFVVFAPPRAWPEISWSCRS